jgi:hypothetical protein
MVYLTQKSCRQGMRGPVASSGNQDTDTRRDGIDFRRESELIEGFPQGLKPKVIFEGQYGTAHPEGPRVPLQSRIDSIDPIGPLLSGSAHLKSFPSEKMKRGHYV